jgi:peptide/nickel transport system substrate-binding protein
MLQNHEAHMPILTTRRAVLAAPMALAAGSSRADETSTLRIGVISDPITLDPAFAGSFFENQFFYNLHESLLMAQPDGTIVPALAESWESQDNLTWSIKLRAGLTLHDGTPLDAQVATANIQRYIDPATGSVRRSDYGPVAAVSVTGPLTFEIKLTEPYAPLPSVLTTRAGMMVSLAALKALGPDFASRPVGCGPYRFVSWTRNGELVMEKFPGYWRGADHGFDRLVFRPISDDTVRIANLRSGGLDLIDSVPPQSVAALRRDAGLRVSLTPSIGFNAWSLNCSRSPFNDKRVRQAFVGSIDPDVVQRVIYFGTGQVARGPLPPAIGWAFDPAFAPPRPSPDQIRQLLTEAGVSLPVPITITVTNSPVMGRIAQVLQAQAGPAGFDVKIREIDPTSLLGILRAHDFDVCMSPWSGRYDPDGNMFLWFTRNGPNNFAGYDSEAVTNLLRQARGGTNRDERAKLYRSAQTLLAEDAPLLFLHFDAVIQASSEKLVWTQYPDAVFRLYDAHPA